MTSHAKVIDLSLFFNEFDLLELRLKTLYDVVDHFVVVESTETFSGKPKPLLLGQNLQRFREYFGKLYYYPLTPEDASHRAPKEYQEYSTRKTLRLKHKHGGKPPWQLHSSCMREIRQRDAAIIPLSTIASDDDLILLSDADEIASPSIIADLKKIGNLSPRYLSMQWYIYHWNNKALENWLGTVAFSFNQLKGHSLDQLRYSSCDQRNAPGPIVMNGGWHFSYFGGADAISAKLEAITYQGLRATLTTLAARHRPQLLKKAVYSNNDILFQGRQFKRVPVDNSFPTALLEDPILIERYLAPAPENGLD